MPKKTVKCRSVAYYEFVGNWPIYTIVPGIIAVAILSLTVLIGIVKI